MWNCLLTETVFHIMIIPARFEAGISISVSMRRSSER